MVLSGKYSKERFTSMSENTLKNCESLHTAKTTPMIFAVVIICEKQISDKFVIDSRYNWIIKF